MQSADRRLPLRRTVGALCVAGLVVVFVFQQINFSRILISGASPMTSFFINRTIRFLLNDTLTLILIWALFYKRSYVVFAVWVQLFGMVFVLFPYFIIKGLFPAYNGPLISFLHRLILNPTLLLLLIPAFYYQKMNRSK